VKAGDDGERLVSGLVTVGSVDSDGEIVDQESAFQKLQEWLALGGMPVTWMHDNGGSCGHCIELEAMTRTGGKAGAGVFVPRQGTDPIDAVRATTSVGHDYGFGTMFNGRVEVNDVWAQLLQKQINTQSIAFRGFDGGEDDVTGAPRVQVQRVFEYAFTTIPAQREAVVAVQRVLKSLGIAGGCKDCQTHQDKGFKRLENLGRQQWRHVLEHAKEHGDDHPNELAEIARVFVDVGKALRPGG